ncbi:MAG: hypothetical protein WBC44_22750 [Planctomycetaceae bacterium]
MTETATRWFGRLLGRPDLMRVDEAGVSFGAAWAHESPGWVLVAVFAVAALAAWLYLRRQPVRRSSGIALALLRASVLSILVVMLAEPVLELRYVDRPKPLLWLLVDGSDSMNLVDDDAETSSPKSRADLVRTALGEADGVVPTLGEQFRLQAFTFDRPDGVRPLDLEALRSSRDQSGEAETPRSSESDVYSPTGTATAIGSALHDLRRRYPSQNLAGIVVISDFVQNAGPAAVEAAKTIDVPVFAAGLGATAAADLAVELDAEPNIKKAERVTFAAVLRQTGLTGRSASVRLSAAPADGSSPPVVVGTQAVSLDGPQSFVEFPVTPDEAGRFVYSVEVDLLPSESIAENNIASRNVTVSDDYLRLLFVEYEPTWEWRFVKEVFHRDRLVGLRGFRTYLRSSDPAVRQSNELFIETLPPPRDEFFQYDVIFLGDVPASALPGRFAEMTQEFVSQFGGGLVVIGGPRFGPQALADSPLANMLPVVLDADAKRRDAPFRIQLTPAAAEFDFMQLGDSPTENRTAWQNLGELPWYQPVRRVESTSTVLAEHPTDTTADGRTPQPLIALRPYGSAGGEVVYLGFNETWRLRRMYGEKYYRQFWGQLIYRLGLGHARGADKRFVIDPLPEEPFAPDAEIPFTVHAWDQNFERLTEEDVPNGAIAGELVRRSFDEDGIGGDGGTTSSPPPPLSPSPAPSIPVTLPMTRPGVFETRMPVYQPGDYRLKVTDPVTNEVHEARFRVADVSVERRVATRDAGLQQSLAAAVPGGRAYELDELKQLASDFHPPRRTRTTTSILSLWDTWLVFSLVVGLLFAEWLVRKSVNLS